jgi:hypothetical protein
MHNSKKNRETISAGFFVERNSGASYHFMVADLLHAFQGTTARL